jgi:hypothetical protein
VVVSRGEGRSFRTGPQRLVLPPPVPENPQGYTKDIQLTSAQKRCWLSFFKPPKGQPSHGPGLSEKCQIVEYHLILIMILIPRILSSASATHVEEVTCDSTIPPSAAHLAMAISDSIVVTTRLPLRKEKRIAVVAFLLLALFGFGFMYARLRPRAISHSFLLNAVDDRAYDARQAPQVRS